jgi:hypothetical protein
MGAFFCVCVLPFKTKFLKKRDEEMKMKMRERERERERSRLVALFSSSVLLQSSTRRQKKKISLSPPKLSPQIQSRQ